MHLRVSVGIGNITTFRFRFFVWVCGYDWWFAVFYLRHYCWICVHICTQQKSKENEKYVGLGFFYRLDKYLPTYITYSNIHTNRATSYCQMYAFDKYFPISIFLCVAVVFLFVHQIHIKICFVCGILQIKSNIFWISEVFVCVYVPMYLVCFVLWW